jgi:hypothetical protein
MKPAASFAGLAILCCAWPCLFMQAHAAETSLSGYTGLLKTPNAQVLQQGMFSLFYSNDIEDIRGRQAEKATSAGFVFGPLPRVELGGRLVTYYDQSDRRSINDLSGNLKINLWDSEHLALAAGAGDFAGQANFFRSRFLVGSARYRQFELSAGYGIGPDRLDGAFGGISWRPRSWLQILVEADPKEVHAGLRLSMPVDRRFAVQVTSKAYSSASQNDALAFSLSGPLDFGLSRARGDDREGLALRAEIRDAQGKRSALAADNRGFRRAQVDSWPSACWLGDGNRNIEFVQYRYGIPISTVALDCVRTEALSAPQWASQWQSFDADAGWQETRAFPWWIEMRLDVDERSFVGTEVGRLDYSLAGQASLRLQLPWGLGAYATYDEPVGNTEDFEDGQAFEFFRHRSGYREVAAQWALHPLPGLIGLVTGGMFEVNEIRYFGHHAEVALHSPGGSHRIRAVAADYEPDLKLFPEREQRIGAYRYWSGTLSAGAELSYGTHFYGDKGWKLEISRFFGDTQVGLMAKVDPDGDKAAGISISLPLTPARALNAGPVTVTGSPRWTFRRTTTFDTGLNVNPLRPLLLIEHAPEYNLPTDWLDSGRSQATSR